MLERPLRFATPPERITCPLGYLRAARAGVAATAEFWKVAAAVTGGVEAVASASKFRWMLSKASRGSAGSWGSGRGRGTRRRGRWRRLYPHRRLR